jgi:hypothetical protein
MTTYDAARYIVAQLQPGQAVDIDLAYYDNHGLPGWSKVDHIMENILGSAHSIVAEEMVNPQEPTIARFSRLDSTSSERLRKANFRTYVSPDRRHLFTKLPSGYWKPR